MDGQLHRGPESPLTGSVRPGETGHLPTRIKQHLQGDSDFGHLVLVHPQLSWASLDLYYYSLGRPTDGAKEIRKALEYVTSTITIAGYTR